MAKKSSVPPPLLLTAAPSWHNDDCACADGTARLLAAPVQARNITNDCACAEAAWGGVASSPALAPFQQTPDTLITPLRDNYRLAFSPLAPHGPSVLNDSAYQRWQSFATPQAALQAFDSQLIEQQLIQPLHERPQWLQETPETLTAWLHITNACNLNCTYCYVRKSSQRMSQETGEQAVDALFAAAPRQGFREIKLKYAGGEPTLHLSLVKHLHHYAQARSQATNIPVQEVLLTNGVHISAQNARWLRDAGIKLAISLDGIGASHDAQRPMANGSGSFAAIAHTIDDILLPLGIHPDITLTITRLNTHAVAEATRWILQRHLPLSLNFYRSNANVRNPEALRLEEQAIILGMKAAYAVFEEILPQHPFLDGLLDRVQAPAHARTCGVDSNYVAISHTGNLAQCQMSLEQTIGHVRDGINLDTQRRSFIHNIPVEEKEDCRTCPFRYRCSGGCPLETYRATGRWDAKSPHCNIYRELYPLALRLEGLRLLKINGL